MANTGRTDGTPDLAALMAEIAAMKDELARVAGRVRSDVSEATDEAAARIGAEASRLYDGAAVQGEKSVRAIGRQVQEQPVASLLIAFALGFLGSRVLSSSIR